MGFNPLTDQQYFNPFNPLNPPKRGMGLAGIVDFQNQYQPDGQENNQGDMNILGKPQPNVFQKLAASGFGMSDTAQQARQKAKQDFWGSAFSNAGNLLFGPPNGEQENPPDINSSISSPMNSQGLLNNKPKMFDYALGILGMI
jgi:hypothetical protein